MQQLKKLLIAVATIICLFSSSYAQQSDSILKSNSNAPVVIGGWLGQNNKLLVLNGKPAIIATNSVICSTSKAGNDTTTGSDTTLALVCLRALDSNGNNWGTLQLIANKCSAEDYSVITMRGIPAMAYVNTFDNNLYYVCAKDSNGSKWEAPVLIASDGEYHSPSLSLMPDNKPAIAYYACYSVTKSNICFLKSKDSIGRFWDTTSVIPADNYGNKIVLMNLNNHPTIIYSSDDEICSIAADTLGNNWTKQSALSYSKFSDGKLPGGYILSACQIDDSKVAMMLCGKGRWKPFPNVMIWDFKNKIWAENGSASYFYYVPWVKYVLGDVCVSPDKKWIHTFMFHDRTLRIEDFTYTNYYISGSPRTMHIAPNNQNIFIIHSICYVNGELAVLYLDYMANKVYYEHGNQIYTSEASHCFDLNDVIKNVH